ncbi:hypothetical protein DFH11DRAFT_1545566 [Phellopilus nigrolimitatus]|nr:hypothetical protein DFH11DRAFT_1545566 [Phellopilus nigrolimitatus]
MSSRHLCRFTSCLLCLKRSQSEEKSHIEHQIWSDVKIIESQWRKRASPEQADHREKRKVRVDLIHLKEEYFETRSAFMYVAADAVRTYASAVGEVFPQIHEAFLFSGSKFASLAPCDYGFYLNLINDLDH